MKTILAPALTLMLGWFASSAFAGSYAFTFTHLCDSANCIDLSGTFAGNDSNGDGRIGLDELQSFEAGGWVFIPSGSVGPFDYVLGSNDLNVAASVGGYRISVVLISGNQFSVIGPGFEPAGQFLWTPQTTTSVQTLSVPEPGTHALLAMGLTAMAWRFARRRLVRQ